METAHGCGIIRCYSCCFYWIDEMELISFVIPCYRSEMTIKSVIDEIVDTVSKRKEYDYEIITVNDASPDSVYDILKVLAQDNPRIKVINLAKNVGKHSAVLAGYSFVKGEYVVNLDDDFQSPIDHLWELMSPVINDECDVATAVYKRKEEAAWKRIGSNINLIASEILLDKPKGLRFENFSVMKRFVTDRVAEYKNPYPFLEGLILRVTKRIQSVPMEQRERADDNKTGFTFRKSVSLFANGFTNFSVKPLRGALAIGLVFALLGFVYGIYTIIHKLLYVQTPMGWSSLMAVVLFSMGIIMIQLGMIGEYVGRIFICINNAPQYVVRETINIE